MKWFLLMAVPLAAQPALPPPAMTIDGTMIRSGKLLPVKPLYPSQLIVVPRGIPAGPLPWPNPVLDFRGPNLRLFQGPVTISGGKQDYFPLGALNSLFSVGMAVPREARAPAAGGIHGFVQNASSTVNAVGIWGDATSLASGARVWGGFLSANSAIGEDRDAQVVGLRVDVNNHSLPGVAPNASKVGMQVVGLGDAPVTNAIEVLAAGNALWQQGIHFPDHSIHPQGTVLGMSQTDPVNLGIDISHTPFKRAAVLVSNGSLVGFRSKAGGDAGMYADDINSGHLVLRSGLDGVRITDNGNTRNLLWIRSDGSIDRASVFYEHYSLYLWGGLLAILILAALSTLLLVTVVRLHRRLHQIASKAESER
jgi:hypothetical protein